jgi:hypothetical protein
LDFVSLGLMLGIPLASFLSSLGNCYLPAVFGTFILT